MIKKLTELKDFTRPTDKRIFAIARGLYHSLYDPSFPLYGSAKIQELTGIDLWFLRHMETIIETHRKLEAYTVSCFVFNSLAVFQVFIRIGLGEIKICVKK